MPAKLTSIASANDRVRAPRMPFVPAGAVTGIGSLPFTSSVAAVDAVAHFASEIPFWPQLPRLSDGESILGQCLGTVAEYLEPRSQGYGYQVKDGCLDAALERLHHGDGQLKPEHAAGFYAFESAMASGRFSSATAVKGQIGGPITLSAYLFYRDRPFLSDPALFFAVAFHVSQMIRWQIDRLKAAGLPVLLFVDEPALSVDTATVQAIPEEKMLPVLATVLEGARVRGAYAGLHCCAARPFERMRRVNPDILSFDADEGLESFFAESHMIDFVRQGGLVAYGIVPTRQSVNALDSPRIFRRWLQAASQAGDAQEFAQRAIITATCGLGLLAESSIAESFGVAQAVGKMIMGVGNH